ncbi:uncharacterized protein [Parasteatoda tepidariorum]|uniref:uncharacterized protein n=1 Tax=Parasteatoda tepidariorum TaxID=114398 RepID=UPI00077F9EFA|nr:uncharacterized protein LOC107438418 [Parasteatoda tepidariorum]
MGNYFFLSWLFCTVSCVYWVKGKVTMNDMEDASEVTWAHAVNSKADLERELAGAIDFLEADVSMGYIDEKDVGLPVPVMAHPPDTLSDITLEEWIDTVITKDAGKGVKLDFKSIHVVEPSLRILQARASQINVTLWLNADILKGPVHPDAEPVKDSNFMMLCNQYFPTAVLSIGWTTNFIPTFPFSWHYEWKHVRKMVEVIKCFGYDDHHPTFTFPVRGIFASRSIKQLRWLLEIIPGSSLTVWSDKQDPMLLQDLIKIRTSFPKNRVFYDVPERLRKSFLTVKDKISYDPYPLSDLKDDQWVTLAHGSDHSCSSNTYAGNNTLLFGKSITTAALLKKLLILDGTQSLKVTGKVLFFNGYDQSASGNHELNIVLTDVSHFSKNSSNSDLNLSGSDTDVIWEALNGSHLYTFKHDFLENSTDCRVFKLDTSQDQSFQAWTLPCEDVDEGKSFEDVIKNGIPEVSSRKRMVLPKGPFMFGFVSSGDGHVAVYDFDINGKKENISGSPPAYDTSFKFISLLCISVAVGYFMKMCFI